MEVILQTRHGRLFTKSIFKGEIDDTEHGEMNCQGTKISFAICKHEYFSWIKARPEGALSNLAKLKLSLPRAEGSGIRWSLISILTQNNPNCESVIL